MIFRGTLLRPREANAVPSEPSERRLAVVSGGGVVTSGKKRLPAASCRLAKSLNLFNQSPAVKQVTSSKNGSCNNARVTNRVSTTARRKPNPQRRTTQHDSAGVREHRNEPSSSDCRTNEAHKWRSRFNIRTVPLSRLRQFVPALLSGTAGPRGSRPASWQRFEDLKISSRTSAASTSPVAKKSSHARRLRSSCVSAIGTFLQTGPVKEPTAFFGRLSRPGRPP